MGEPMKPEDFSLTPKGVEVGENPDLTEWLDKVKEVVCEQLPKTTFRANISRPVKKTIEGGHAEVMSEIHYYKIVFGEVNYNLEVID